MKNSILIKKGKDLLSAEISLMNRARMREYGENDKNFKKNEQKSIFFFVKNGRKIVSFGMLKPIRMSYLKEKYNILGIGNIMSIEKKKGYGKILIGEIINYLKKKGKTGLGFCGHDNLDFYRKSGLKGKESFTFRFALKNPKTGKVKFDADDCGGIYYNGKDNFINKVLRTKSIAYYYIPELENPHW